MEGDGSRAIPPMRFASITRYILLGVEHRRHDLANYLFDRWVALGLSTVYGRGHWFNPSRAHHFPK